MGQVIRRFDLWLVVLTVATLIAHWANFESGQMISSLIVSANDTEEHLGATDQWVDTGSYSLDGETPYAARMPGYAFPYVVLRLLFEKEASRALLVLFQLALYVVSVWLSYRWLSERYGAILAFSGMTKLVVFNYMTHIHFKLLPVSIAVSLFLILFFLHYRLLKSDRLKPRLLLLFGVLLTWLGFLRPYMIPFALLWPLVLLWQRGRWQLKPLVFLFLPFALVEGAWVGRNLAAFGELIPLQTTFTGQDKEDFYRSTSTKQSVMHLRPFIMGFGGDNVWYFPGSAMGWFLSTADQRDPSEAFPQRVFDSGISAKELVDLKLLIAESYRSYTPAKEAEIVRFADGLSQRLRDQSWFDFYIAGRFKAFNRMVFLNVSQDWPMAPYGEQGILGKLYRLACVVFWAVILLGGLALVLPKLFRRYSFMYAFILYGTVFMFLYLFKFMHYQYFIFAWIAAFFIWMDALGSASRMQKFLASFAGGN